MENKPEKDEKIVIFRTTRILRDRLVRRAAKNVLDGTRMGLGSGSTYSVNHAATEIVAKALNLEFERGDTIEATGGNRVGMSFLFPMHIFEALKNKAEKNGVSVNQELQRILENGTEKDL